MGPQYKDQEVGKFLEQNGLRGLEMVQFEHPLQRNPCVSSTLEDFPFPIFPSLGYFGRWTRRTSDHRQSIANFAITIGILKGSVQNILFCVHGEKVGADSSRSTPLDSTDRRGEVRLGLKVKGFGKMISMLRINEHLLHEL